MPRSYVQLALDYAHRAVADTEGKIHGKYIRAAARRFLDDLERDESDCGFEFSPAHAEHACDFIEKLPHVEGNWDSPTIVLHPAQIFFVVQLFGFRDSETGRRRFTSALYATARKSGKSTLAAAIMLYCMCCEQEPGAQLMSAATTYQQASIIFEIAKKMVQREPDLREAFGLEVWSKAITMQSMGSNFRPIHAKASTQDGLNPSHAALDEIHAHKDADLLNVLTSAAGARACPLWLYTTTEGYYNPGPWQDLRLFAKKLLDDVFKATADHFLAIYFAVDPDDDDFDESAWVKANPLIEQNPNLLAAIRKEAIEAKEMPSKMGEFRTKRLNRAAANAEGWIDLLKWDKCSGPVDLEQLKRVPCWAGLDLASNRDFCSFALVWVVDGIWYCKVWRWVPANQVTQRTERGTVPYASWVEQGLLKETPGDSTDHDVLFDDISTICSRFNVQTMYYDRYNAGNLITRLESAGVKCEQFIQGVPTYHGPMQNLERVYVEGKLRHGGDPVLSWCASNLVAYTDAGMRMKPDKRRSAEKIDDMCALLMAMSGAENNVPRDYGFLRDPIILGNRR